MATKKKSSKKSVAAIDRQISAARKKLNQINAKKRAAKTAQRKLATLRKLQTKLKNAR